MEHRITRRPPFLFHFPHPATRIHRLKSMEDALAVDAPVDPDALDALRKLFKIKQTDRMAMGRAVERYGAAPVSRTQ